MRKRNLLVLLFVATTAVAQAPPAPPPITIRRAEGAIRIDGDLSDPGWKNAATIDKFYETPAKIESGECDAEYRIPFSCLRYTNRDLQNWNIIVWRNYPSVFRYAIHSAPITHDSNCRVCHTVPIVGLTGLPHAGHM